MTTLNEGLKTPVKNYTSNPSPSKTPTVSLMSVMDEEYAIKISSNNSQSSSSPSKKTLFDEMKRKPHPQSVIYNAIQEEEEQFEDPQAFVNEEEEMDEELRMVLEMSAREAQEQPTSSNKNNNNNDPSFPSEIIVEDLTELRIDGVSIPAEALAAQQQLDEDFAAALQLQEDFESEQLALKLQKEGEKYDYETASRIQRTQREKERRIIDPGSKVSVSYDPNYSDAPPILGDDSDEEFSEEEDEIMKYLDELREQTEALGSSDAPGKNYGKGRLPAGMFVTKHDITISGIKNAHKIEKHMDAGNMKDIRVSNRVYNNLSRDVKKSQSRQNKIRGNKRDQATAEKVMDATTKSIVFKMLNSGVLREIHGVVSTGKEANVYHGITGSYEGIEPNEECAVKIFKTTLNEFKNRSEYVEGEFRFRHKKSQHNPRKLIKLWAEKETRNLKRLMAHGITCPTPILLRENILLMSFIGKEGFPSPRLRDAQLSPEKWSSVYHQVIKIMRKMYHECRLVHADLSEYNLMYRKSQVIVIDVAQSVEHDHPHALDFLKKDCLCMSSFFRRKNVKNVMSTRQLFEFVVDPIVSSVDVDNYVQKMEEEIEQRGEQAIQDQMREDAVFLQSFIPRTLLQVKVNANGDFDSETHYHEVVSGLSTNTILFQMLGEQSSAVEEGEEGEEEEEEEENETESK